MQTTTIRADWTPKEKRYFEDVALEFIRVCGHVKWADAEETFTNWLLHRHTPLFRIRNLIWSYVVTNWVD